MSIQAAGKSRPKPLLLLLLFAACITGAGYAAVSSGYAAAPFNPPVAKQRGSLGAAPQASPTAVIVAPGQPGNWGGSTSGASNDPSTCVYGVNCDKVNVTINNPGGYNLFSRIQWPSSTNDLDYYFCQGTDANPCQTILASSAQASTYYEQLTLQNPPSGSNYYGVIVNFAGSTTYTGTASLTLGATATSTSPAGTATPTPISGRAPGVPGYQNYAAPNGMGGSGAEPSIGVDWATNRVMFQADIETIRVTFDITCSGVLWEDRNAPTSATTLDPILFTDPITKRTIVHQLTANGGLSSFTDDDGDTYTPSEGSHLNESTDHQTIGGGNYALGGPLPLPAQPYTHAVYYCAQGMAEAACARSDTGGLTYNPGVPIYTIPQCGGLHGHVKVSPDGSVYVPNKSCGGQQGVAVSDYDDVLKQNGQGWVVRTVPGSQSGNTDPSVGIGSDNTLYIGMQSNENGNTYAKASRSTDHGRTWTTPVDVGATFGIQNAVFPAVVAGDGDRAAFAFIGTPTGGDYQNAATFNGVWHLYVAHTFDRGLTWTTVDVTPNDPVQRGSICTAGTACGADRNLLDFIDATVDSNGRTLIGYADGCIGNCVNGGNNSFSQLATIARQSGGRRLFAQYAPVEPAAPNPPIDVKAVRQPSAGAVRVSWTAPDTGGSPIILYKVYRGTTPSSLVLIGNTTITTYNDAPPNPSAIYYYAVSAVNAVGESYLSCPVSPAVIVVYNTCALPGTKVADDPAGDTNPPAQNDVDTLALYVAEPRFPDNSNNLVFTIKLQNLSSIAPNRQYFVVWNSTDPANTLRNFVRARSNTGGVAGFTYDYGRVADTTNAPMPVGPADGGSVNVADNTISITIANSKVGNPGPGTTLGVLDNRNFTAQGDVSITYAAATDSTAEVEYTLVGNVSCAAQGTATTTVTGTPPTATTTATIAAGTSTTTITAGTGTSTTTATGVASTATGTGTAVVATPTSASTIVLGTATTTATAIVGTSTTTATSVAGTSTTTRTTTATSVLSTTTPVVTTTSTVAANTATRTATLTVGPTNTTGQPTSTSTIQPSATRTSAATGTSTTQPSGTVQASATAQISPSTQPSATTVSATETATTGSSTPTVCPIQFTDVPADNTFYPYVRCLACRGIMSGYPCGRYDPITGNLEPCDALNNPYFRYNNPITRGQISKLVANSAAFNEDAGTQVYEDVPVGSPFYAFIQRLSNRGFMGGYSCGTTSAEPCLAPLNRPYFRPGNNASRGQISKIVSNAARFGEAHTEQTFEDVGTASAFYIYIQRLASRNVMQGYPCSGTNPETGQREPCGAANLPYFRPGNTVTRGQSSKIVANSFFPGCQTPRR